MQHTQMKDRAPAATGNAAKANVIQDSNPLTAIDPHRQQEKEVILSMLRVGVCRLRLLEDELEAVGLCLGGGNIDSESALLWLDGVGALEFCRLHEMRQIVDGDDARR